MARCQRHGKIGHAVRTWQQASHDTGVRSVRDRAGSEGLREAYAVSCQSVECRRLNVFVAVAVNVVGAKGIDGDQENVGLGRLLLCLSYPDGGVQEAANYQYPGGLHAFQTSISPPVGGRPAFSRSQPSRVGKL